MRLCLKSSKSKCPFSVFKNGFRLCNNLNATDSLSDSSKVYCSKLYIDKYEQISIFDSEVLKNDF